ncbi:MAG: hypothetical protein C5B58_02975 [Acidobacteria bacterium]|nr:MAG: hypothetical protein C5B58_02975 [Acidobacteriota bacterium]
MSLLGRGIMTSRILVAGAFASALVTGALPLFATWLGALGLLGWRRKTKAVGVARLLQVAILAGVVFYSTASTQASTIYNYISTDYARIVDSTPPSGTYTTDMRVAGSVTLTNSLGPNAPLQFINDVESFSFSDGRILYTPQNSSVAIFFLSTGATGTVNRWDIELRIGSDPNGPHVAGDQVATLFLLFGIQVDDNDRARFSEWTDSIHAGLDAGDTAFPGTWTTTPLPAALPLFATALGGLGLLSWRRKRVRNP